MPQLTLKFQHLLLAIIIALVVHCSTSVSTGGSTDVSCKVSGRIYKPITDSTVSISSTTTEGAPGVEVLLLPADYNPLLGMGQNRLATITDSNGCYTIDSVPAGIYAINANDSSKHLLCYRNDITVPGSKILVDFGCDTIEHTGKLVISFGDSTIIRPSFVYIPGSPFHFKISDDSIVTIDLVSSQKLQLVGYYPETDTFVPLNSKSKPIRILPDSSTRFTLQNSPPIILSIPSDFDSIIDTGSLYLDTIYAEDPDGDSIFFTIMDGPADMVIGKNNGVLKWSPALQDLGTIIANVVVSDDREGKDTIELQIKVKIPFTESGTLIVPEITIQPSDQKVPEGETATFSIAATGPSLRFQWLKDYSEISGAESNVYITPPTTVADDSTKFICIVSNTSGSKISNFVLLTVIPK